MTPEMLISKSSKVMKVIGIVFFCIGAKLWLLTVIQKDEKIKEAQKPKIKSLIQYANRGPIYDRYGIPLALNRIKYNACIYYAQIRQYPSVKWQIDERGVRYKAFPRKEHIKKLSDLLAKELDLNSDRIEDLIYSKASLLPHIPFLIKENIDEKTYYTLKMLEKDFLGLHAEQSQERFYPQNKAAAGILGFMGPISEQKYQKIACEIKNLSTSIKKSDSSEEIEEMKKKLNLLKEKAYLANDQIGKSGIEAQFDEILRGIHGQKNFEVDVKGNFLKELSYKKPLDGKKLTLAISSELQLFCEELLAKDEKTRNKGAPQKFPFIKGGAIVVMNPKTGELLSLASYPRFNPNDFVLSSNKKIKAKKQKNILKWIENKEIIKNIFDGKAPLEREFFLPQKNFFTEEQYLSLDLFLQLILPKESELFDAFKSIKNIKNAVKIQENFETLLYCANSDPKILIDSLFSESDGHLPFNSRSLSEKRSVLEALENSEKRIQSQRINLISYLKNIKNNKDKLLVIDLCRILVHSPSFSDELINKFGDKPLSLYWDLTKQIVLLDQKLMKTIRPLFSEYFFKKWKIENQKDFLKQKREEENEKKTYSKPYIEHLDNIENKLFDEFWEEKKNVFLSCLIKDEKLSDPSCHIYFKFLKTRSQQSKLQKILKTLRENLKELDFNQTCNFIKTIRSFNSLQRPLYGRYPGLVQNGQEKDLAAAFYPKNGFGFSRSLAFQEQTTLGSIFKIAVAYSALKNYYDNLPNKESSSFLNPFTMTDMIAWHTNQKNERTMVVGFSENKRPFYRFYKGGRLPKSSHANIGKIDLISALAQSSNPYFAILAGDYIEKVDLLLSDVKRFSFGSKTQIDLPQEISGTLPSDLESNRTGLYSFAIGQHTLIVSPLQTAVMLSSIANGGEVLKPQILKGGKEILQKVDLPPPVRNTILEGLDQTLWSDKGNARASVIKKLKYNPPLQEKFLALKHKLIGKTSTAEVMHKLDISSSSAEKYNDIWFGGIYFEKEKNWKNPELVIVVYLKYGEGGKEAAPLAAEIVHKYEQIKEKYASPNQQTTTIIKKII